MPQQQVQEKHRQMRIVAIVLEGHNIGSWLVCLSVGNVIENHDASNNSVSELMSLVRNLHNNYTSQLIRISLF
jgi:hypothetical protein